MDKNKCAEHIRQINLLSAEKQQYLYGKCDEWCLNHFKTGFEIVAIMQSDNHKNGIIHCYIRNPKTEHCYDVRGEFDNNVDILTYTGIDYNSDTIEEHVFNTISDFKTFLHWIESEIIREEFLVN